MTDTDNEIIKFIEHAINSAKGEDGFKEIYWEKLEYILNFIKRQKAIIEKSEKVEHFADKTIETANAEIERLEKELMKCKLEKEMLYQTVSEIQTNAIKEFAERFAKALSEFDMSSVGLPDYDRGYKDCMTAIEDTIDSLVKMTEVQK